MHEAEPNILLQIAFSLNGTANRVIATGSPLARALHPCARDTCLVAPSPPFLQLRGLVLLTPAAASLPKMCVFIAAVPIITLFAWGEGDSGGHVLRETTS